MNQMRLTTRTKTKIVTKPEVARSALATMFVKEVEDIGHVHGRNVGVTTTRDLDIGHCGFMAFQGVNHRS